jgi:AmmeMemoRadiSam system protein B
MADSPDTQLPKLRPLDIRPIVQDGRTYLLLRDPLQLTDRGVSIPQQLGPFLSLCDGTRDNGALSAALAVRFGLRIAPHVIEQLLDALDEVYLLDNERFVAAREAVLTEYRQAPHRPSALAGRSYPADPDELRGLLDGYCDEVGDGDGAGDRDSSDSAASVLGDIRGLVSPHIDYMRGGPVYARAWKRATEAAKSADLVVLLGTDHMGSDRSLTLTRQHYATPLGVLPTAHEVVDTLAASLGEEAAFADELHHRTEHSIELAAVWLQYVRDGAPCELVPILCGSFGHFVHGEVDKGPGQDPAINTLVDVLKQAIAGRRAVVVAAADLAHIGPAFGGQPVDFVGRARLQAADDELIASMCAGDAEGFFGAIRRDGDRRNVCGLAPIYLTLRILSPVEGEGVAYDRCPADQNGTSLVSICGVVFS